MQEYDNTNKGSLWKTEDESKKYILNGTLNVNGKDFMVFAYKVESENPKAPRLNLSVLEKTPMSGVAEKQTAPKTQDEIPF